MCITIKEVEEVVDRKNEDIYNRVLEKIPQIIASVANTMEHKTAPSTQIQLNETKYRLDKNDIDHAAIEKKVDSIIKSQDEHGKFLEEYGALLKSIDEGVKARLWFRNFIKDWWHIITIFLGIIGYAIYGLYITHIDKK